MLEALSTEVMSGCPEELMLCGSKTWPAKEDNVINLFYLIFLDLFLKLESLLFTY